MPQRSNPDVVVVGGGIVGLSTAMALSNRPGVRVAVIEAEARLAAHQTGNNSGVIHSGLYYKPGSLKARNCVTGRRALIDFCERNHIAHDICGKVVVATDASEIPRLDELERRGLANGLSGLKRLRPGEIREIEPHVAGIDGLWVPETGIVDFRQVAEAYAKRVRENGSQVKTSVAFVSLSPRKDALVIETDGGEIQTRYLINCAGLQSDRVALGCGVNPGVRIVPFRGEYYRLGPAGRHLVRNLIYPVPNPEFPFLGVHFTRMMRGGVEAGPNAVLALKREGYRKTDISLKDTRDVFSYSGFYRLAARYWKTGIGEFFRSFSKEAFVRALQKLIPELTSADLAPGGAGVRAQALAPDGRLLDDFHIVRTVESIHVLNAPSPAATASISIGEAIATMAAQQFGLPTQPWK